MTKNLLEKLGGIGFEKFGIEYSLSVVNVISCLPVAIEVKVENM